MYGYPAHLFFLEPAIGIGRGDAKIIKNAGNAAVDRDVIRSVAAAIHALGVEEVMVIGHYDCGMPMLTRKNWKLT